MLADGARTYCCWILLWSLRHLSGKRVLTIEILLEKLEMICLLLQWRVVSIIIFHICLCFHLHHAGVGFNWLLLNHCLEWGRLSWINRLELMHLLLVHWRVVAWSCQSWWVVKLSSRTSWTSGFCHHWLGLDLRSWLGGRIRLFYIFWISISEVQAILWNGFLINQYALMCKNWLVFVDIKGIDWLEVVRSCRYLWLLRLAPFCF